MTILQNPVLIAFGVLFIILGLAIFGFFPRAKRNSNLYKEKQLELYKEKYKRNHIKYDETNMFLPAWEKVKVFSPLFFGLVFIIIGISFLLALH